jgi:hypothetical protein
VALYSDWSDPDRISVSPCPGAVSSPVSKQQFHATVQKAPAKLRSLKVTLLSTMQVCSTTGLGEWGFPALIEADGHRVSLDTGAHPDTVLQMHIT